MLDFRWDKCYYNPYKTDHWEDEAGKFVDSGEYADIAPDGVLVFNYLFFSTIA